MFGEIIVACISFVGTALGSVVSIITANKLTNYKIDELKKEVEKHNGLIDRMYKVEQATTILEEKLNFDELRIEKLERKEETA